MIRFGEKKHQAETPEIREQISSAAGESGARRGGSFRKRHRVLTSLVCVFLAIDLLLGAAYGYFHSKYLLLQFSSGLRGAALTEEELAAMKAEDDRNAEEMAKQTADMEEAASVEARGNIENDDAVYNILLIGTDDRTKAFSDNARGDSCILCSINTRTGRITLVSFERGMGMPVLDGEYEGQYDWLTHCFRYGGADLMMQEIRECFKLDVDKYVRVNLWTYMQLVDSVGGIDMDMTEAEVNNINHPEGSYTVGYIRGMHVEDSIQQDLEPGVNHLNGATAMVYARLRSIDSDWRRIERQRKVILACVDQVKHLNALQLDKLFNEVLPLVQTNLTERDIANLLTNAPAILNADFQQMTVPLAHTYGVMRGLGGRSMFAIDFDTNSKALKSVLYGDDSAEETTAYYENLETPTYRRGMGGSSAYRSGGSSSGAASSAPAQPAAGTAGTGASVPLEVVSTETDPLTGVVTITYRDPATGALTVTAVNPSTGAQTTTVQDPSTGETVTAHSEGSAPAGNTAGDATLNTAPNTANTGGADPGSGGVDPNAGAAPPATGGAAGNVSGSTAPSGASEGAAPGVSGGAAGNAGAEAETSGVTAVPSVGTAGASGTAETAGAANAAP
ncbi:LCP family protein [Lachnoclostridium sp. Marseille-P6806]|uniref:LCP family protein n=1 Tax=Lachnoclostridium sp. Marseille-P6806 TaxID=2364793 RepID=UPI001031BBD2|nr:LCP family protein [Lachnoclostridium sp. Marseille-P6806]